MRKPLFTLTLLLMLAGNLVAQKDSAFKLAVIIKTNPGLMATAALEGIGEYGGTVQVSVTNSLALFVGGGSNVAKPAFHPADIPPGYSLKPSNGYTIRLGGYYFSKENMFFSGQFFYRKWYASDVFKCDSAGSTYDYILNPPATLAEGSLPGQYDINNCSATVVDFSILFGKQIIGKKTHLFFEWYGGAGYRFKAISIEDFGEYTHVGTTWQAYSYRYPVHSTKTISYPEIKLGIQIGVKL